MDYEHTQFGYTGIFTALFMLAVSVPTIPSAFADSVMVGALVALLLVFIVGLTFWFSWLRVTVADGNVTASFGMGKPHRVVPLADITNVRTLRNRWYEGWGVRTVPGGWMYNVWGLDAVEVELTSGKVFRIGTDQPDQLHAAISLSLPR